MKICCIKGGQVFFTCRRTSESFCLSVQDDEVVVQLKKALFQTDTPEEITVTVEWPDSSD